MLTNNHAHCRRFSKGFSLIEAAIVLGIIGLVIGGIWTAAASISTARQSNQIYASVMTLRDGVWGLYKGHNIAAMTSLAGVMANSGSIPKDWAWNNVDSPLGGVFTDSNGVRWNFYAEYANRPKLFTTVGSATGQLPAAICSRLRKKFFDINVYFGDTDALDRLSKQTGGVLLSSYPRCVNSETFQLDFNRLSP